MPPSLTQRRQLFSTVETLLVSAAGGALFTFLHFPAGWLAGAAVFSTVAALLGRPIYLPIWLGRIFYISLGISIGTVVTPETLRGMATWPLSIVAIVLATVCVTFATMTYLERVHGWSRQQAVLAGVPGALSQVMVLAAESRVDMRGIVMVQTLRVLILAIGVPAGLALFGLVGATSVPTAAKAIVDAPLEFAVLVVGSTVTGIALFWGGFSGGLIFGPMLVSAVLHGGDFVHVALPSWFVNMATVGLGAIIGSRFTNTPIRLIVSYLGAAVGSFLVAIVITIAFALAVSALLSLRISDVLVAYAPGSVDVMMIMSLALKLDPVFVGAHHLARVFSVSLTLPFLVRMTAPKRKDEGGEG